MKQVEPSTVVLDLVMVQADRIWTQFRYGSRHRDIGEIFKAARETALRKDKGQAPDEASIRVRVEVTRRQARTILNAFRPLIGAPHDASVYEAVKKAINED